MEETLQRRKLLKVKRKARSGFVSTYWKNSQCVLIHFNQFFGNRFLKKIIEIAFSAKSSMHVEASISWLCRCLGRSAILAKIIYIRLWRNSNAAIIVNRLACVPIYLGAGAGFTKPCALLKLDFLTSAYKKCMR